MLLQFSNIRGRDKQRNLIFYNNYHHHFRHSLALLFIIVATIGDYRLAAIGAAHAAAEGGQREAAALATATAIVGATLLDVHNLRLRLRLHHHRWSLLLVRALEHGLPIGWWRGIVVL